MLLRRIYEGLRESKMARTPCIFSLCVYVGLLPFYPLYISLIQIIRDTKEDHFIIRGLPNYIYRQNIHKNGAIKKIFQTLYFMYVEHGKISQSLAFGYKFACHQIDYGHYYHQRVIKCTSCHQMQTASQQQTMFTQTPSIMKNKWD